MKSKSGMTLVELLVVLVILASVAVSVAVSSSGMLERTRVDRTAAQGEVLRDALEAHDGLSIVSDLGISYFRAIQTAMTNTVDGTDTALLNLLFDYRHPREITVEVEGAEPASDTIIKEVAAYQTRAFTNTYATLLSGIVTNATLRKRCSTNGSVALPPRRSWAADGAGRIAQPRFLIQTAFSAMPSAVPGVSPRTPPLGAHSRFRS